MLANSRSIYKTPKLRCRDYCLDVSFVNTGVKKKESDCCSIEWFHFKCSMCDMYISLDCSRITRWVREGATRRILEGHKHELYVTVNGKPLSEWLSKMQSIFDKEVYKKHAETKKGLVDVECTLCGVNLYVQDIDDVYHRRFEKGFDDPRSRFEFKKFFVTQVINVLAGHFNECDAFISIRTEFVKKSEEERERLIGLINEYMKKGIIENDNYVINVEKYNYIISAESCRCSKHIIVNCKICGSNHKVNKRGDSSTSTYSCTQTYKSIVRSHLTNVKGSIKYDYRDIITPINKKVHIGDGVHNWTHDGYKCSICGVEYEKTGNKLDSMPDKIIVLAHAAKCIPDNQEAISASGRHCI